jgi:hypothetical protein
MEQWVPRDAMATYVFAHGAGAGMLHPFMSEVSEYLATEKVATVRFNFPYMEAGKRRPDVAAVAEKTIAAVAASTIASIPSLPLFVGGKSFGGRMASHWVAKDNPSFVRGLIFFGFPLHPLKKPDTKRAAHLTDVHAPMLFLQGTRDALADRALITATTRQLPLARLVSFEKADHSFRAGKNSMVSEAASACAAWIRGHVMLG